MGIEINSSYSRAVEMLNLVKAFSPDARIVYDPSRSFAPGGDWNEVLGTFLKEVAAKMLETNPAGAFAVCGTVDGFDLAILRRVQTIVPGQPFVFLENVASLDAEKAGNFGSNAGLEIGDNLVALQISSQLCELHWSKKPFNEKQN